MSTQTRHFLLTPEGGIREFSAEQAALIAAGADRLPEFAGHDLRYLQLTVEDVAEQGELRVQTAGARIHFDAEGRLSSAGPPAESEPITRFEHDAVVQWALRDVQAVSPTFH
ncbi:MAG: hypothetical protein AB1651_12990 [Pseudomonadota bacterium]|jgi:hypothetical protein